jgi:predicted CXXCH cytochrome family protein
MCGFCHVGKSEAAGKQLHEPVAKGECLSCHDPHGSNLRNFLRGNRESDTCMSCHEQIADKEHLHTPVAEGSCTKCHQAHSSLHDHLLVAEGRALCMQCHESVAASMPAAARAIAVDAHEPPDEAGSAPGSESGPDSGVDSEPIPEHVMLPVHEPVLEEECSTCHDPHASSHAGLLSETPLTLCTSCHTEIAETAANATVAHSVVTDDRACLNCHAPHSSGFGHLLTDWQDELCLECHREPVERADGSTVAAASEFVEPHTMLHIENGRCTSCHDVHGAEHRKLLALPYTDNFYEQYNPEAYALCLSCHDAELVTKPETTLTQFRNGPRNLHYAHVTEPANGRSCRACHTTHAATGPGQLRATVDYGRWSIPIDYEPSDTGGTCAAGCHRARSYDRDNPVANEPPQPSSPSEAPSEAPFETESEPEIDAGT